MNAVIAAERKMIVDDRFARLEADVEAIKEDVRFLHIRLNDSIVANGREFGAIRSEMEKGFGVIRAEFKQDIGSLRADTEKGFGAVRAEFKQDIGTLRADMEKGFGALRSDMEKNKGELSKSIESTKLWMIMTGAGALMSAFDFLGRVFKVF